MCYVGFIELPNLQIDFLFGFGIFSAIASLHVASAPSSLSSTSGAQNYGSRHYSSLDAFCCTHACASLCIAPTSLCLGGPVSVAGCQLSFRMSYVLRCLINFNCRLHVVFAELSAETI